MPMGARFKIPMPLLLYHKSDKPVGRVEFAKPTKEGIPFRATLPNVVEPGVVQDRVNEAYHSLKYLLIGAVSIGFRALEGGVELLKSGGLQFNEWEWLELSLVSIPAQPDAVIQSFKSLDSAEIHKVLGTQQSAIDADREHLINTLSLKAQKANNPIQPDDNQTRAALGLTRKGVVRLDQPPGASGTSKGATNKPAASGLFHAQQLPKGNEVNKTLQEQIAAFEAKRTTATNRMTEIMTKAGDAGETLDEAAAQEHDELTAEVAAVDKHVARLKSHEAIMVAKGMPVGGARVESVDGGAAVRVPGAVLSVKPNLEKGVEFARYVKCLAASHGNRSEALEIAKAHYPDLPRIQTVLKAAVAAATTTDASWAGNLVDYMHFSGDFVDYLRPQTIIGKFGQNGIPSLFNVPFNIEIPTQTSGGAAYWQGQGAPAPLTSFAFDKVTMRWAKIANIAVLTSELVRFSDPAADVLVRNALGAAIIAKADSDFVDPSVAAVTDVSPASVTNGVTPVASSGTDADAVRADIANVMKIFIAANLGLMNGVWIMPATTAMRLSLMRNSLGQKEFPDVNMLGGRLEGLPVIVSQYVPNSVSGGGMVILMDAQEVYLSDDGQVVVDASREASLQMLDNPTNNSSTGTATTMVSMFQTDSIAIKAMRVINWKKRRAAGVQYIDGVHWGE